MSTSERKYSKILEHNYSIHLGTDSVKNTLNINDVCITIGGNKILNGVYGTASAGEMLAVMGPSGSGKTTLLESISGRIPISSGSVVLNGELVTRNIRRKISYVKQSDVFNPNLTLRETLTFTALIVLPEKMSHDLKIRRMLEVVDILELNKCLDTKMGGLFSGGLSGGERKRASIACDMMANPKVLLIDEPTSGLDSAIAQTVISTLSTCSKRSSQIIITTIHQPSSQVFHMFSKILLLTDGQVAYFGAANRVVEFFDSLGLHCHPQYNPADFIIEQMKAKTETIERIVEKANRERHMALLSMDVTSTESNGKHKAKDSIIRQDDKDSLHDNCELSDFELDIRRCRSGFDKVDVDAYKENNDSKWQTGFTTQYLALTKRLMAEQTPRLLSLVNLFFLINALFVGMEFYKLERSEATINERLANVFLLLMNLGYPLVIEGSLRIYDDHGVFYREKESGMYRLSAYYLATMTSEVPFALMVVIVNTTPVYWMTGFAQAADNFFSFMAICGLYAFVAQGVGFLAATVILNKGLASSLAVKCMILLTLVAGFYNPHPKEWFLWIRYVSFITFAFSALGKVEFMYGGSFACNPPERTVFPESCVNGTTVAGSEILRFKNLDALPLYGDVAVLFGFLVSIRIVVYIVLRFYGGKSDA